MELKKNDFIEIEFTGKVKDGEIFDSNIKEDLKKIDSKIEAKPFVLCLGQEMFLKAVEDFLTGKNIGNYEIELAPEQAFGMRNSSLVQMIPMKIFIQQKINPIPGAMFNFDGRIAKILTVSGGRVMVDFNNPLAGKNIVYKINILRKIEDLNEKIKSVIDFFFRKEINFEIKEKKLILDVEDNLKDFVKIFKDKFKEIFELELEVKEKPKISENKEKKENSKKSQQSL